MQTFQIYKNLADLNELPDRQAEAVFLGCCGSAEWARQMIECRPFAMLEGLFETAEKVWSSLSTADHLEAFAAERAAGESESADLLEKDVRDQFEEANRLYESRFGFIFIVDTSGKSGEEILAICRARLGNSIETELKIAAHELEKITGVRLCRLLEK